MISYGEKLCRRLLSMWFPSKVVLYNYRPDWLRNPNTGRNLELDIYYPDLGLAVEFQGFQHHLLLQRRKDYFKTQECSKIGILLLSVYEPLDLFKCKKLIKIHTGIKTISGRSMGENFLTELRIYPINSNNTSGWYNKAKEESDLESNRCKEAKFLRRKLKKIIL